MNPFAAFGAFMTRFVEQNTQSKPTSSCACCCDEAPTTMHLIQIESQSIDVALCERCLSIGADKFANRIALCTMNFMWDVKADEQRRKGLSAEELEKGWP